MTRMRWLFCDPKNPQECRRRQQVLKQVDDWWRAFSHHHPAITETFRQRQWEFDVTRWIQDHRQVIDDRLCWEFGPGTSGSGHRLVITPESEHWLRPIVRTILARAPQLPSWEFYPYRLSEVAEQAIATVEGRVGLDVTGAVGVARIGACRPGARCFHGPAELEADDQEARCAAFVATESLVGEEILDHWIGCIDVGPPAARKAKPDCRLLSLDRVGPTVDALIGALIEQLPAIRPGSTSKMPTGREWSCIPTKASRTTAPATTCLWPSPDGWTSLRRPTAAASSPRPVIPAAAKRSVT
jgi:hypothetical protein